MLARNQLSASPVNAILSTCGWRRVGRARARGSCALEGVHSGGARREDGQGAGGHDVRPGARPLEHTAARGSAWTAAAAAAARLQRALALDLAQAVRVPLLRLQQRSRECRPGSGGGGEQGGWGLRSGAARGGTASCCALQPFTLACLSSFPSRSASSSSTTTAGCTRWIRAVTSCTACEWQGGFGIQAAGCACCTCPAPTMHNPAIRGQARKRSLLATRARCQ